MLYERINLRADTLKTMADVMGVPCFLLEVRGPGDFVFLHLNARHEAESGLLSADFVGKSPAEILPPRLAESVLSNYEACRLSAKPITYEECLDLAAGPRWWLTTLSPVLDAAGKTSFLLGSAIDITARKSREFEAAQTLVDARLLNEELKTFAAMTSLDATAPLETIMGLFSFIRDGFIDLGDQKLIHIGLCEDIAQKAVQDMRRLAKRLTALAASPAQWGSCDLGRMLRDIVAELDPVASLSITLPMDVVQADRATLYLTMKHVLRHSIRNAVSSIEMVMEKGKGDVMVFQITYDPIPPHPSQTGPGNTPVTAKWLDAVRDIVDSQGGFVTEGPHGPEHRIVHFSAPGRILEKRPLRPDPPD